jgi:hypothetical protein
MSAPFSSFSVSFFQSVSLGALNSSNSCDMVQM